MKIQEEVISAIEKMINEEVEKRIKEYPVYVRIDGDLVDSWIEVEDGQIDVNIELPIFFQKSDRECVLAQAKESNNG